MKPKTPFALAILSGAPEDATDTQSKHVYSMTELGIAVQTIDEGDFRFVQLDSDNSETYLQ